MARRAKANIISDRESEMSRPAFDILLVIKHNRLPPFTREELLKVHFDLCYHGALFDNQVEDICRSVRQRRIAQQPGPWPEGYFENRAEKGLICGAAS